MKIIQMLKSCLQTIDTWQNRWLEHFGKHPGAWLLFGLFLLAEHANYNTGHDLNEICDLVTEDDVNICIDGDCDFPAVEYNNTINRKLPHWQTHLRSIKERASDICASHEPDDYEDQN